MFYSNEFAEQLNLSKNNVETFKFGGETFLRNLGPPDQRKQSDEESFTIVKTNRHLNCYYGFTQFKPKSVIEIGYYEGGSSVLIDRMFNPEHLTCIDRRKTRIDVVDDYIKRRNREKHMHVLTDFDQSDVKGLRNLLTENHDNKLDLVFDDASHLYDETKASMGVLFPKVKSGGFYVIEDYGWAHANSFQSQDHPWFDKKGLSTLIFELMMVLARGTHIVRSMYLDVDICIIERGSADCGNYFDPLEHSVSRGRDVPIL